MRRRCRMDRQRARITDIGDMIKQRQRVNKGAPCLMPAGQLKADKPAIAALQVMMRPPGRHAFMQARIIH